MYICFVKWTNETWIYFRVVNVQCTNTWCFSNFLLRMPHMCSIGFRSGDILGHSFTFTVSRKAVVRLGGVFRVVMLENSFWKDGDNLLHQNVTLHVGIHVSLNEPQLPSISLDPCEACSEWNPSWKPSVWPWPLYCNSVPECYRTS